MSLSERETFLKILKDNDSDELKKWILTNGKKPKVICPIEFITRDNLENNEGEDNHE